MRNIGGSILPSNDVFMLKPKIGKYGTFQTKIIDVEDTHALFFGDVRVASHPNGFSCDSLASRIMDVWEGKREEKYAMDQFEYILACGGKGNRDIILMLVGLHE